jgi:hypothetical protein
MMNLAVREDDIARAESLVTRVGKDYADSAMFAVAHGDSATVGRLLAEARDSTSVGEVMSAAWQVGDWLQQPAVAERFARAAAARPERRSRTSFTLAENLIEQGKWAAADSAYRISMATATDNWPRVAHAIMATLPFLAVPRAELTALQADLTALAPTPPGAPATSPISTRLPELRLYALGLLASRLGESDAALRAAAELESASAKDEDQTVTRVLAAVVRADAALAARRPADALRTLEAARGEVPLDLSGASVYSEDYARFLRAEALLALGRDDEALRWLENGFDHTADESMFRAPVSLRLGDVYERKGQRQRAIDEYARFVRYWAACDDRLRPAVGDARARLARLTAEPRS